MAEPHGREQQPTTEERAGSARARSPRSGVTRVAEAKVPLSLFESPLGYVANADDADGTLAGNDRYVTEAAFDHRLAGFLDGGVLGHRHRVWRHPFPHPRFARVHAPRDSAHEVALREDPDHPPEVGDDHSAHAVAGHLLGSLADRVGRLDAQDVL